LEFQGKVALITGGSRGIGRAVALALAEQGADLAINFLRDVKTATSVCHQIERLGRKALPLQGNVGNEEEIKEVFSQVRKVYGGLDILVHCASLGTFRPLTDTRMNQLTRTLNINCNAFVVCTQEASKLMRHGGVAIAVSSLGSQRFVTSYGAVGMAKAALESAVRYLSVELAEKRIRVNAVSGGPIDTEGLRIIPNYEARKRECMQRTPYGRLGTPEEIARIICFLCSSDSFWICGQTIIADGGLSLRLLAL